MKMLLNNLSIKSKIIGNSLILMILLVVSSGYAWYAMTQVGNELEAIADQDIPMTEKLTAITEHQLEQAIHFERAMRYGVLLGQEEDAITHLQAEIVLFNKLSKQVEDELHEGELLAEESVVKAHSKAEAKEFEHVDLALKKIEKEHADFEHHAHQIFDLLMDGNIHEAEVLAEKIEHEEDQLNEELEALLTEVWDVHREGCTPSSGA